MGKKRAHFVIHLGKRGRVDAALLISATVILVAQWVAVFAFLIPRLGTLDFLRLHYTATVGIDWVGPWWLLLTLPVFGVLVVVVNMVLAPRIRTYHKALSTVAYAALLATQLALTVGVIMAIKLNV